jgi:integrase
MATHGERIRELAAGNSVALEKIPLGGALEARKLIGGSVQFYWRYTEDKKTRREPIGTYDSSAPPKSLQPTARGYSIQAALERARELAKENIDTPGGIVAARERKRTAAAEAHRARVAQLRYSLSALCDMYVRHLKAQEKVAWRDVENLFDNHVTAAHPEIAALPANEITKHHVMQMLRSLTQVEKKTAARKLRSYLHAAFACAARADSDADLPAEFIGFKVEANPVEATAAIKGKADKNPLSVQELQAYWRALKNENGVTGAALRLQLLLGGQRIQQLARLTAYDVNDEELQLVDRKGKRVEPRIHLLPITRPVQAELSQLPKKGFVLSSDDGETAMHSTSLSGWANEVAERAKIDAFQLKRVRSGVETALAALRVPPFIRGQLQSHGIGGVQDTHYDAYAYIDEKREVLVLLHRLLEGLPVQKWHTPAKKAHATAAKKVSA